MIFRKHYIKQDRAKEAGQCEDHGFIACPVLWAGMIKTAIASALMLLVASAASAEAFKCHPVEVFPDVVANKGDVQISNFAIHERSAWMSDLMTVIEVSYAVGNRGDHTFMLSGQFVGRDADENILFAVSVAPTMDMVQGRRTEAARRSVYVDPGTIDKVRTICMMMIGHTR